jgi:hypothetical protein
VQRLAREGDAEVLEQERNALERPIGELARRLLSPLLEEPVDDGVQVGVERLDPRDRGPDELDGADLPASDERCLRGRVERRELVGQRPPPSSKSNVSSPTVNRSGRSETRRTASRTPGMKELRSMESCRTVSVCPAPPKITYWWATSPGRRTE